MLSSRSTSRRKTGIHNSLNHHRCRNPSVTFAIFFCILLISIHPFLSHTLFLSLLPHLYLWPQGKRFHRELKIVDTGFSAWLAFVDSTSACVGLYTAPPPRYSLSLSLSLCLVGLAGGRGRRGGLRGLCTRLTGNCGAILRLRPRRASRRGRGEEG